MLSVHLALYSHSSSFQSLSSSDFSFTPKPYDFKFEKQNLIVGTVAKGVNFGRVICLSVLANILEIMIVVY